MEAHPVATAEQHAHELAALELVEHPTVRAALRLGGRDPGCPGPRPRSAMRERLRRGVRGGDVLRRRVVVQPGPAAAEGRSASPGSRTRSRGARIPGSRWGIDNPDTVYRVIPISGDERYDSAAGSVPSAHDRELLHPLGPAHGHRRRPRRATDAGRGRRLPFHDHRRRRRAPATGPTTSGPARGARVLHPRRAARLGPRRLPTTSRCERLGGAPATPALTLDEQAEATAAMMAHFADFTGKLSHGMYKSPANHFAPRVVGRPHRRAAPPGLRRRAVRARAGRGVRGRRERRRRRVLHGADLEHLGHDARHRRPDRQPQQGAVAAQRGRHLHLRDRPRGPRRAQLDRHRRPPRGHPHAADGGVPRGRRAARPLGHRPGRPARPSSTRSCPTAPRVDADERAAQLAERRAAYLRRLPEVAL